MSPSPPSTPQSTPNLQGVFRNERWLCNCEPRLDAVVKVVKQNSKNYGKRFYACPRYGKRQGNHCEMFLLVDDAKPRELECLITNGRSEKRQATLHESMMTPSKGKQRMDTALTPLEIARSQPDYYDNTSDEDEDEGENSNRTSHTATPTTQPTGSKRKRSFEEEDLLDDLSSGGEEELLAVAESSSRKTASTLGQQRDPFITPSATRTTNMMQNGLPTPSLTKGTSVKKVLFRDEVVGERSPNSAKANSKRQRLDDSRAPTSDALRLFGTDATIGPASSPVPTPSSSLSIGLTSEVMGLLKNGDITPAVCSEVQQVLERYMDQARGYERGWEASRMALKEAEGRAMVLMQKVGDLERSRQELRNRLLEALEII